MAYERARKWLEEKHIPTRKEAEQYLTQVGEFPSNHPWIDVLDAIYPEAEIATVEEGFILNAISQQQKEELSQGQEDLTFLERVGRTVRRFLRGEYQQPT